MRAKTAATGGAEDRACWERYYEALEGRPPRPLFLESLPLLPAHRPVLAVDLGSGDGTETIELLRLGWTVLAVDENPDAGTRLEASLAAGTRARLTIATTSFEELVLPRCDLVHAGMSLPFCEPQHFDSLWRRIVLAIRPGGWFVGHLFGDHDSWASEPDMTFLTRDRVEELLRGFDIHSLHEQDEEGDSVEGPKHWHIFHVIARRKGHADSPSA
jgi:SAM-dependent methyltransferase